MSSTKSADGMINELLQSPMQVGCPFFVRRHVVVAKSWPDITSEGFQVSSNIQVFGVVVWAQVNGLFVVKRL